MSTDPNYFDLSCIKDTLICKPNNIKGFQIVDIDLGFNVKILSPVYSKKKNFPTQLDDKDLMRMKYEWPKNNRGLNVYEGFFV